MQTLAILAHTSLHGIAIEWQQQHLSVDLVVDAKYLKNSVFLDHEVDVKYLKIATPSNLRAPGKFSFPGKLALEPEPSWTLQQV